jgi:hypothetical protein
MKTRVDASRDRAHGVTIITLYVRRLLRKERGCETLRFGATILLERIWIPRISYPGRAMGEIMNTYTFVPEAWERLDDAEGARVQLEVRLRPYRKCIEALVSPAFVRTDGLYLARGVGTWIQLESLRP